MSTTLTRIDEAERAAYLSKKFGQFERLAGMKIPGLTMRRAGMVFRIGFDGTTDDVKGNEGLIESVIIGRPRKVKVIPEGRMARLVRKAAESVGIDKRSADAREIAPPIDLSDEQIDQIIARWTGNRTAKDLKFAQGEA